MIQKLVSNEKISTIFTSLLCFSSQGVISAIHSVGNTFLLLTNLGIAGITIYKLLKPKKNDKR